MGVLGLQVSVCLFIHPSTFTLVQALCEEAKLCFLWWHGFFLGYKMESLGYTMRHAKKFKVLRNSVLKDQVHSDFYRVLLPALKVS